MFMILIGNNLGFQGFGGKTLKERDYLEELGVDGLILKLILKD